MDITLLKKNIAQNSSWSILNDVNSREYYHYTLFEMASSEKRIYLIDCGNSFDPYYIVRAARYSGMNVEKILKNIMIARMFTVFQFNTKLRDESVRNDRNVIISDLDRLIKHSDVQEKELKRVMYSIQNKIMQFRSSLVITLEDSVFFNSKKSKYNEKYSITDNLN